MPTRRLSPELALVLKTLSYAYYSNSRVPGGTPTAHPTFDDAVSAGGEHGAYAVATITAGQLEAALYQQFKNVLEVVGGKWISANKEHRFECDPKPAIDAILSTGALPDANPFDYYPTPKKLADSILSSWADSYEAHQFHVAASTATSPIALEPSCGRLGLAAPLARLMEGRKDLIRCLELDPINAAAARAEGFDVIETDFLQWQSDERYLLILMNPPFNGREWFKHLKHAFKHLASTGTLICIAPKASMQPTRDYALRDVKWILTHGTIEENPSGSFADSGTNIETVTITMSATPKIRGESHGYPSYAAHWLDLYLSHDREVATAFNKHLTELHADVGEAITSLDFASLSEGWKQRLLMALTEIAEWIMKTHLDYQPVNRDDLEFLISGSLREIAMENYGRYQVVKAAPSSPFPGKPVKPAPEAGEVNVRVAAEQLALF